MYQKMLFVNKTILKWLKNTVSLNNKQNLRISIFTHLWIIIACFTSRCQRTFPSLFDNWCMGLRTISAHTSFNLQTSNLSYWENRNLQEENITFIFWYLFSWFLSWLFLIVFSYAPNEPMRYISFFRMLIQNITITNRMASFDPTVHKSYHVESWPMLSFSGCLLCMYEHFSDYWRTEAWTSSKVC